MMAGRSRKRKVSKKRKIKRLLRLLIRLTFVALILVTAIVLLFKLIRKDSDNTGHETKSKVSENVLDESMFKDSDETIPYEGEYEQSLKKLLKRNPEIKDYVKNFNKYSGIDFKINLKKEASSNEVPLLMQWDKRWGYNLYAGEPFGISGCGPTCLSMVCLYILGDEKYSPKYIGEFAEENGYSEDKSGSYWSLISEGGEKLGLDVVEITNDEQRIINNLNADNPIICVVGPGDFTDNGHFIVMTKYVDGKIKINDPFNKSNSEKLWDYDDIQSQLRGIWVCRKKGA